MKKYKENTVQFSLKDRLFNVKNISELAERISHVHPTFKKHAFIKRVINKFPDLELKERIDWITDNFEYYIEEDYKKTVEILLASLPDQLDPNLSDNDFGEYINGPYGHFVATRGCYKAVLPFSLQALKEMTKRFSVEGPIRVFINQFPDKTFTFLEKCACDKNYHVRRLASEGTRPRLPWYRGLQTDYTRALPILDMLYTDNTRYVTRSVANHLNDISKDNPQVVIETLKRWKKEGGQAHDEMEYITRHSLRTLIGEGDKQALALIGYEKPHIDVSPITAEANKIQIGGVCDFTFTIESKLKREQALLIDYVLYFQKKNGEQKPKTFKIKKVLLAPGERITIKKKHPMKSMSTKTLYSGSHSIELQINGEKFSTYSFELL